MLECQARTSGTKRGNGYVEAICISGSNTPGSHGGSGQCSSTGDGGARISICHVKPVDEA